MVGRRGDVGRRGNVHVAGEQRTRPNERGTRSLHRFSVAGTSGDRPDLAKYKILDRSVFARSPAACGVSVPSSMIRIVGRLGPLVGCVARSYLLSSAPFRIRTCSMTMAEQTVEELIAELKQAALADRHYFVRKRLRSVHSTICPRVFGVNTLPRVASSNFFMSSRRTPKPRPPIHATTWNRGFPPTAP